MAEAWKLEMVNFRDRDISLSSVLSGSKARKQPDQILTGSGE